MVYVIQRPHPRLMSDGTVRERDLRPAIEFGSLRYIFEAEDRIALQPSLGLDRVNEVLKTFDPDQDYVLWPGTGDPAAMYLVLLALGGMRLSSVRFLYWSRELDRQTGKWTHSGHYWVFTADLDRHWRALVESGGPAHFPNSASNGTGRPRECGENWVGSPIAASAAVAPFRRIRR